MLITDIAVTHHAFDTDRGEHTANVSLTCADSVVRLICRLPGLEQASTAQCMPMLVRDALRQIRRMPEYRTGEASVRFTRKLADVLATYPGWSDTFKTRTSKPALPKVAHKLKAA